MCHIWKNKERIELTPLEWRDLLKKPYFDKVQHVGITGGEPTLNNDLEEFYTSLPDTLPALSGASFITNGFSHRRTVSTYGNVHKYYRERNLSFEGIVSIDGIGETHDKVRGIKRGFDKATKSLFSLRDQGVPVIIACTIVKENVYGVHDLLDWAIENEVYVRFRVGEFINRLYNLTLKEQIRAFNNAEIKHLLSFFAHLRHRYEQDETIKRTYSSIESVLSGGKRLTTCPYQNLEALNIDSQGRFAHCAPKGEPHKLGRFPRLSVFRHIGERKSILENSCSSCIHDYHHHWTEEKHRDLGARDNLANTLYQPRGQEHTQNTEVIAPKELDWNKLNRVMLLGWYGTETLGDIAILIGVIERYLRRNPELKFTVVSLFPEFTRMTIRDLTPKFGNRFEVIDYHDSRIRDSVAEQDLVAVAGGPLMDLEETKLLSSLFIEAKSKSIHTRIEGCGLGPLAHKKYRNNVKRLFSHADQILLRDHASVKLSQQLRLSDRAQYTPDPAIDAIQCSNFQWAPKDGEPVIVLIRELTDQYPQPTTPDEAHSNILQFLTRLLDWFPEKTFELNAMSHYTMGSDDRLYARRVAKALDSARVSVNMIPQTTEGMLKKIASAPFAICMRYHSIVFAHKTGTPFFPIDYTNGGKIAGYLNDIGQKQRALSLDELPHISKDRFNSFINREST